MSEEQRNNRRMAFWRIADTGRPLLIAAAAVFAAVNGDFRAAYFISGVAILYYIASQPWQDTDD